MSHADMTDGTTAQHNVPLLCLWHAQECTFRACSRQVAENAGNGRVAFGGQEEQRVEQQAVAGGDEVTDGLHHIPGFLHTHPCRAHDMNNTQAKLGESTYRVHKVVDDTPLRGHASASKN